MTPEEVRGYFTHADGSYRFARWTVPVAPEAIGSGVTQAVLDAAWREASSLSGHPAAVGSAPNYRLILVKEWRELAELPGLGPLLPGAAKLAADLAKGGYNQFRQFDFDASGGIRACIALVRTGGPLGALSPEGLAFRQAVLASFFWSIPKLVTVKLMTDIPGGETLRPEITALLRAGYRAEVPAASRDAAHAALIAEALARLDGDSRV